MKNNRSVYLCRAAMTAVLYVILTYVSAEFGLASGAVQVRLSEALCVLPVFMPAAVPGLAVGCFFANLMTGCVIFDVIFGTLATLLGAMGTYVLRNRPFLFLLPPILSNMIIIPFVLRYAYHLGDAHWYLVATIGAGEFISAGILGYCLYRALNPHRNQIFK